MNNSYITIIKEKRTVLSRKRVPLNQNECTADFRIGVPFEQNLHRRLYGRSGQYSTVTEHMPQEHQKYLEWNGDRFRKWADSIGINTSKVVDAILTSGRIEQQSYRSCMGLLKLAEKYSPEKLEQVCAKALSYSGKPSYKSIKNLLAATKDAPDTESESSQAVKPHGITRGARYYGGKNS